MRYAASVSDYSDTDCRMRGWAWDHDYIRAMQTRCGDGKWQSPEIAASILYADLAKPGVREAVNAAWAEAMTLCQMWSEEKGDTK